MLSHLCWMSRCAFGRWKEAQADQEVVWSIDHERRNCKRNAQQYLNKITGTVERRIQKRDNMFCEKHPCQFWSSTVSKHIPDKILVNNNFITDLGCVLSTWAEHFESLSQSQKTASAPLSEIQKRIQDMERCSFNEVTPFWCSFW